jgi:hypothetical protein
MDAGEKAFNRMRDLCFTERAGHVSIDGKSYYPTLLRLRLDQRSLLDLAVDLIRRYQRAPETEAPSEIALFGEIVAMPKTPRKGSSMVVLTDEEAHAAVVGLEAALESRTLWSDRRHACDVALSALRRLAPPDAAPVVVPAYADNGAFSHWRLVDRVFGTTLWEDG